MEDSKIAELEAQRVHLLHKCVSLELPTLYHSPGEGKWSVIQVLEHLVISEELSISYVFKKTIDPSKLKNVALRTRLYFVLMNFTFKINVPFKASKKIDPIYKESASLEDLIARWEVARAKLEELSKMPPNVLNKGIFKHPRIGYLNFSQMLGFFSSHYAHHLVQINAIVEKKMEPHKVVSLS